MARGVLFVLLVGWLVIVHAVAALFVAWMMQDGQRLQMVLDQVQTGQGQAFAAVAIVAGPSVLLYFILSVPRKKSF